MDFSKLFHIRQELIGKRLFPFCGAFDSNGKFHTWYVDQSKNAICDLPVSQLIEGAYFSQKQVAETDYFSPFLNFVYQTCLIEEAVGHLKGIEHDLYNLSACLAKLEFLHEHRELELRRTIISDIEYIVSTCRSLFDLLQEVICKLWHRVRKKNLPSSFNKLAFDDKKPRTREELKEKFDLTPALCEFYINKSETFRRLRDYRVRIEHGGLTLDTIFVLKEGFGVPGNYEPFASFGVWRKETFLPNNIAPLRPILASFIGEAVSALDEFAEAFVKDNAVGVELAPGYRLFVRSPHIDRLNRLRKMIDEDVWYTVSESSGTTGRVANSGFVEIDTKSDATKVVQVQENPSTSTRDTAERFRRDMLSNREKPSISDLNIADEHKRLLHKMIELNAFFRYEAGGRKPGTQLEDWLAAERDVLGRQ